MLGEILKERRPVFVLIGGVLVMLPIGSLYSSGNMAPYIVSYCRYKGIDPSLSYQTASFILAAGKLGHGLTMWLSGYLEKKFGVRLATFIGAVVFNAAVFASAGAIKISFYFLLFTYGLLFGVGLGLAYGPPLVCVMKWMPERKGVVNGLLLAGFGAGSLIFNIIQTVFINPDNLQPDVITNERGAEQRYYSQDVVLDRVPFSFILQGIIFSIMQIIGILLLGDPPSLIKRSRRYAIRRKEKKLTEKSGILMNERPLAAASTAEGDGTIQSEGATGGDGYQEMPSSASEASPTRIQETTGEASTSGSINSASTSTSSAEALGDHDPRWSGRTLLPSELFRDRFFWHLIVALFMDSIAIMYVVSLYKAFGQTFIHDDLFLAIVGSCAAIFNALGRVFWGHIADRFALKVSFMLLSACMAVFAFTFGLNIHGYKVMYFIWVAGMFFSIGGVFSTAPTATSRAFGSDFVGTNYGFVYLIGLSIPDIIAAFTQQLLLLFLSWDIIFIIVGVFPAMGMIISFFFNIKTPDGADI